MNNNKQDTLLSFKPALVDNWILQVSQSELGLCIVMFHRFTHKVQISYVKTRDEAAEFVTCVLNK